MTVIAPPTAAAPGEIKAAPMLKILVVDDSLTARGALRSALEKSDYHYVIVEAESGDEALKILQQSRFDIIFCDIHMPGITGPEMLAQAFRDTISKPFMVLMSTKSGPIVQEIGRKIGVYEFLQKPFKAADVLGAVAAHLRLSQPIRMLLIDDSATARKLMARLLHQSRFQIMLTEAESGEEAIARARTQPFDVIFVDFNMPGRDGVETAGQLITENPKAQIVVISSEQEGRMVRAAQFVGAFAFLKKPFSTHDIDLVLHDAFSIRRPSLSSGTHAILSSESNNPQNLGAA
jgi:two-component system, chemotaxis family, chemotaxis protein CheY